MQGFEISAAAWERDILPLRVASYDPSALDMLTWTGRVGWARSVRDTGKRASAPIRTTPIALFPREHLHALRAGAPADDVDLSDLAQRVQAFLREHGASFVHDIARGAALLRAQVDAALAELVAQGLVSADGFSGLRALFSNQVTRSHPRHGRARAQMLDSAGRYSLLPNAAEPDVALVALPDAVGLLRKLRREEPRGELVSLSGTDPLNLIGIITPGVRFPAVAASRLLLRDGVPIALLAGGQCRFLVEPEQGQAFALEAALRREAAARGRGTARAI